MNIRGRTMFLNGRPLVIYSGEFHYFRVPRRDWPQRLAQARRLGLNTIGFYIPWLWHEPTPGRFDFTGRTHSQRDLDGFLSLLKRMGFHAFARLGPICHGELMDEGLPAWLLDQHPEIRLRQADRSIHPHRGLISYGHATYRAFVSRWYQELLPLVRRHAAKAVGPIVLAQLDNEISMLNWVLRAPDYSAHVTEAYQAFLRRRYPSIRRLNHAYNSAAGSFDEITQPLGHVETEGWLRCLDWARFYRSYYAGYFAWLARMVREAGVRVPLVANIPQCYDYNVFGRALPGVMTTLMFGDFAAADRDVLFGGAYQLRHVTFENFHDLLIMNEVCRMISAAHAPSICAELQMGVVWDRPRLYPSDVALTLALSFGGGLCGVNGYMLSAGKNEPGMGARGRYHEWQAAIAGDGTLRSHAAALRQAGDWVDTAGLALASLEPLYDDLAIGIYPPYYLTEYLSGAMPKRLEWFRDQLFFDGLVRLLMLAGYRAPWVDLERESLSSLRRHRAIVALSMEFMDRATQAKLADYVRAGGRLVLYPTLPTMDLHLAPEPLLMRALGVRRITAASTHVVTLATPLRRLGAPEEVFTEWSVSAIEAPGASVWARTPQGTPCAVRRRIGRGEVGLIGFGMTHRFDYQVSVAAAILQALRIHPRLEVEPWDVPVMVRAGARGQALLTICNPHEEARSVSVRVRLPDRRLRVPDAGRMMLAPRSVRMLPIGLELAKGVRVRLSTCELRLLVPFQLYKPNGALEQSRIGHRVTARSVSARIVGTALVRAPAVSLGATLDAAGHGLLVLETRGASGVNVQGARALCRRHGRRLRVELFGAPSAVVTLSLTSRPISFKK